jgi:DNA recombination protein RmuC
MDTSVMAAAAGGMVFGVGAAVIFLNSRFATERSAKIAAEAALKPLQDQLASVQKEKQQLDERISAAQAGVTKAAADVAAAKADLQNAQSKATSLQADIAAKEQRIAEVSAVRDSQQAQLATLNAQKDALTNSETGLKGRIAGLESQLETLRAQLQEANNRIAAARAELRTEEAMKDSYKLLGTEIAKELKEKIREESGQELDEQRKAIEELTKPYTDAMKALSDQTEELLKGRTESDAVLKQHIADLAKQAEQMTRVFSRPKDRGNWGELQLENVAESVGLRIGVDYVRQQQVRVGNQTLIPDMVVSLPSGSKVVIDSKMPIDQFDKAMQAETEEEHLALLRDHAKAVRKHIDDLSGKQYHHHFKGVDHVILYLPTEALYHTAIEADPDLIKYGLDKRVVLTSPGLLIGLLRTTAWVINQHTFAQNVEEIRKEGANLYKGVAAFIGHFQAVGKSISAAAGKYNDATGSLQRSVLAKARNLHKLGVADAQSQLPAVSPLLLEPMKDVQLDQKVLDAIGEMGDSVSDDDALLLLDGESVSDDGV